jgi:hypothetical protein
MKMTRIVRKAMIGLSAAVLLQVSADVNAQEKRVGYQGTERISAAQQSAVYVEPVMLTEVYQAITQDLNVGAVISNETFGAGLQKAADIWGLNLDLFVVKEPRARADMVRNLLGNSEAIIVVDTVEGDNWDELKLHVQRARAILATYRIGRQPSDVVYRQGMDALRAARAKLLARIPKYDQILPIAFPISPLPDSFFGPTKFPYPAPLTRAERTAEGKSASAHAHTSCNMVAQTGTRPQPRGNCGAHSSEQP